MKISVLNLAAWPKHKQLSRKFNNKLEVYKPTHSKSGITFDLPDDYAEHLLDVSPSLFGKAQKSKAKTVKEAPSEDKMEDEMEDEVVAAVDLEDLSYADLQALHLEKTGIAAHGVSKVNIIAALTE